MIPRLYWELTTPPEPEIPLHLNKEQSHYLTRVLRLRPGNPLIFFTGDGGEWHATLAQTTPHCTILPHQCQPCPKESPLHITLVQGLTKPHAMELVIQKSVELGVTRLIPLLARRSVDRPAERPARWRRIAIEAAEQCGRDRVPEILAPTTWHDLPGELEPGPRLLFWEEDRGASLQAVLKKQESSPTVTLLVGPEGGFHAEEVAWARDALDVAVCGLGPRILRAETAALTALTALQLLWGDLG